MVIDKVAENVKPLLAKEFMFPEDILDALSANPETWINYQNFTEPYRRIRVAYVKAARKRSEEFKKRLTNLVKKTTQNKQYGYGVERFYNHEITR